MPYFGYARQDRKAKARDPISAKLVADLLTTAGADRLLTMDLHAAQIQGFFNIPVDHLLGAPLLSSFMKERVGETATNTLSFLPTLGSVHTCAQFRGPHRMQPGDRGQAPPESATSARL